MIISDGETDKISVPSRRTVKLLSCEFKKSAPYKNRLHYIFNVVGFY